MHSPLFIKLRVISIFNTKIKTCPKKRSSIIPLSNQQKVCKITKFFNKKNNVSYINAS